MILTKDATKGICRRVSELPVIRCGDRCSLKIFKLDLNNYAKRFVDPELCAHCIYPFKDRMPAIVIHFAKKLTGNGIIEAFSELNSHGPSPLVANLR